MIDPFSERLYLRSNNEQGLIDVLPFARTSEAIWIQGTHEFALVILGDLYNDDAVYSTTEVNEAGEPAVITPKTKKIGFHANMKCTQEIADMIPNEIKITPPPAAIQVEWA